MQETEQMFDPHTLDLATPEHYEQNGYPHAEWTWLRRHHPVFLYERPNVDPFWAITKHADIIEIGKQPDAFVNRFRLAVFTNDLPPPPEGESRHLLNMDPPDHARYRRVTSSWFTPRAIRGMDAKVERVAREVLDDAAFRIVRMASPYARFPPDIRRDTDLLVITRTWFFGRGDRLWTE